MEIDCGRCQMRGAGCQDCVVTVLEPRNVAGFSVAAPGYLGEAEVKALAVLAPAVSPPTATTPAAIATARRIRDLLPPSRVLTYPPRSPSRPNHPSVYPGLRP